MPRQTLTDQEKAQAFFEKLKKYEEKKEKKKQAFIRTLNKKIKNSLPGELEHEIYKTIVEIAKDPISTGPDLQYGIGHAQSEVQFYYDTSPVKQLVQRIAWPRQDNPSELTGEWTITSLDMYLFRNFFLSLDYPEVKTKVAAIYAALENKRIQQAHDRLKTGGITTLHHQILSQINWHIVFNCEKNPLITPQSIIPSFSILKDMGSYKNFDTSDTFPPSPDMQCNPRTKNYDPSTESYGPFDIGTHIEDLVRTSKEYARLKENKAYQGIIGTYPLYYEVIYDLIDELKFVTPILMRQTMAQKPATGNEFLEQLLEIKKEIILNPRVYLQYAYKVKCNDFNRKYPTFEHKWEHYINDRCNDSIF